MKNSKNSFSKSNLFMSFSFMILASNFVNAQLTQQDLNNTNNRDSQENSEYGKPRGAKEKKATIAPYGGIRYLYYPYS